MDLTVAQVQAKLVTMTPSQQALLLGKALQVAVVDIDELKGYIKSLKLQVEILVADAKEIGRYPPPGRH